MTVQHLLVGIGSPHGEDAVGWLVCAGLAASHPELTVRAVRQPLELLWLLDGVRHLAIVDACRTGAPAGTIWRWAWPHELPDGQSGPTLATGITNATGLASSHGVGIAESLRLAQSLGRLPERVTIFGIEITDGLPGAAIADVVQQSLTELCQRLADELQETNFHGAPSSTGRPDSR